MPYYTAAMVRFMRQSENASTRKTPVRRSPIKKQLQQQQQQQQENKKKAEDVSETNLKAPLSKSKLTKEDFDLQKLKYQKNLLKLQARRIAKTRGPFTLDSKEYQQYTLAFDEPVQVYTPSQYNEKYFRCYHKEFGPRYPLCVRVVDNYKTTITNQNYFKILRHLGKKHPMVIQIWEQFVDETIQTVYIIQSYTHNIDLFQYIDTNGCQPERLVWEWALQLHRGLDYLGDMAICHNHLTPIYIFLSKNDLSVQLSGFYEALCYWSDVDESIMQVPCLPADEQVKDENSMPDFHAPEVFGSGSYDPIISDTWSYGAVLFFCLSSVYPYNYTKSSPNLDKEIGENIALYNDIITEEFQDFLKKILRTNPRTRLSFDKIHRTPWFALYKQDIHIIKSFPPKSRGTKLPLWSKPSPVVHEPEPVPVEEGAQQPETESN